MEEESKKEEEKGKIKDSRSCDRSGRIIVEEKGERLRLEVEQNSG